MDLGAKHPWDALAAVIIAVKVAWLRRLVAHRNSWTSTTASTVEAESRPGGMFLLLDADIALAACTRHCNSRTSPCSSC